MGIRTGGSVETSGSVETAIDLPSEPRTGAIQRAVRLLSCIRFDEVLILQGTPLFGALFAIGKLTGGKLAALALMLAGSFCLVSHVFGLNDWSGSSGDLRDPHRASAVYVHRGIGHGKVVFLSIVLLGLSLLLLGPFGWRTELLAAGIAGLSAVYSAPAVHAKGIPLLSSALHLAGGVLHFLLGYSIFHAPDARGVEIGCFFALTFAAGHCTHEARDLHGDMLSGITTNAVHFGQERGFAAGLALFMVSYAWLAWLALSGTAPRALIFLVILSAPHLYWSLQTWQSGLNFHSIRRLQVKYRALFAVIGLTMAIELLLTSLGTVGGS